MVCNAAANRQMCQSVRNKKNEKNTQRKAVDIPIKEDDEKKKKSSTTTQAKPPNPDFKRKASQVNLKTQKPMPIEAAVSLMKGPPSTKQFITYQHTPKLPASLVLPCGKFGSDNVEK